MGQEGLTHVELGQVFDDRVVDGRLSVVLGEEHEHHVVHLHGLVDDDALGAAVVRVSLHDELLDVGLSQFLERDADELGFLRLGVRLEQQQ